MKEPYYTTILQNNNITRSMYHHFFPALSFNMALENGLPIDKKLLNKLLVLFKKDVN